jgi:outer membrane protein TolC
LALALSVFGGMAGAQTPPDATVGSNLQGLLAAGHALSPALRAAALESEASAARAAGAGALDDPTISDNYQYYESPGVFSAHTVMISQAFPLWGKRDLRREAAQADVDAARGREQAARDELDEKIKASFARYVVLTRSITINHQIQELARRLHRAAEARYAAGGGSQPDAIRAQGEETANRLELIRLESDRRTVRILLNTLINRNGDTPLAEPTATEAPAPAIPPLNALLDIARTASPALSAQSAEIAAASKRGELADRARYPDITIGAGPVVQTNNHPVGFAVTVGLNIPVPWGREASGQQEAAANLNGARQRYDAALRDVEAALGEASSRLEAARQTGKLLRAESLPQARTTAQAMLAAYSEGRGSLADAIDAERRIRATELALLQAKLDEMTSRAAIERLIGRDL